MIDLMLDIETMGKGENAAIVSIGACQFDLTTGETGLYYYEAIDLLEAEAYGLSIDASTVLWWFEQGPAAVGAWKNDRVRKLEPALAAFTLLVQKVKAEAGASKGRIRLWANAPTFDCTIVRNAYVAANMTVPWRHFEECCVRTLVALARIEGYDAKSNRNREGMAHHALDDCLYQIQYCHDAWRELRK